DSATPSLGDHATELLRFPIRTIHESPSNPSSKQSFSEMMVFCRGRGVQRKGRIGASTTGEWIMRREHFDGRRFLMQVLLCVNIVIGWGASLAWPAEEPRPASKPAEYAEDTFVSAPIRVWRFDQEKKPAVLLLHGADGGVGVEKLYIAEAKRLAS